MCLLPSFNPQCGKLLRSHGRPFSAPAPGNVERIRDAMLRIPRRSARRQAVHFAQTNAALAEFCATICNCSHSINFYASPQDSISGQTHFSFRGRHLARPLVWPCSTRLLSLGLRSKRGTRNTSCKFCWLKTTNSVVYSKNPQGNATPCYYSLTIATAGLYWTIWCSPTVCHIPTMNEIISHGHGMHPIILLKCSTLP